MNQSVIIQWIPVALKNPWRESHAQTILSGYETPSIEFFNTIGITIMLSGTGQNRFNPILSTWALVQVVVLMYIKFILLSVVYIIIVRAVTDGDIAK